MSDSVHFESNGFDDESFSPTNPSLSLICLFCSLSFSFSDFFFGCQILSLFRGFEKYNTKQKILGHFLTSNRISCFLSLAGNSCFASLEGIHNGVQLRNKNNIILMKEKEKKTTRQIENNKQIPNTK